MPTQVSRWVSDATGTVFATREEALADEAAAADRTAFTEMSAGIDALVARLRDPSAMDPLTLQQRARLVKRLRTVVEDRIADAKANGI